MTEETKDALKASIEHWVRFSLGEANPKEKIYSEDCALCKLFNRYSHECIGCPVAEATGERECENSDTYMLAASIYTRHGRNSAQFKEAAARQADFLRTLLPNE